MACKVGLIQGFASIAPLRIDIESDREVIEALRNDGMRQGWSCGADYSGGSTSDTRRTVFKVGSTSASSVRAPRCHDPIIDFTSEAPKGNESLSQVAPAVQEAPTGRTFHALPKRLEPGVFFRKIRHISL
jgi:hypothetical protein